MHIQFSYYPKICLSKIYAAYRTCIKKAIYLSFTKYSKIFFLDIGLHLFTRNLFKSVYNWMQLKLSILIKHCKVATYVYLFFKNSEVLNFIAKIRTAELHIHTLKCKIIAVIKH